MTSSDPSLATRVVGYDDGEGHPRLGLIAKRRYRLHHGRLQPDGRATEVRLEATTRRCGEAVMLERETDLHDLEKRMTDVLLLGTAHAHGVARELEVGLRVGPLRKKLTVHGARFIALDGAGRPTFSSPEPFERAPLDWTEAYGGRDRYAERKLFPRDPKAKVAPPLSADRLRGGFAIAYVRNRVGRGYYIDGDLERLVGAAAPSLSDPTDPVRAERILCRDPMDWVERPLPAGFGPIDALTFPRSIWARITPYRGGSATMPREVERGSFTPSELVELEQAPLGEIDPRLYQCAPPGQIAPILRGDEPVELHHLDPSARQVSFALPGERPRLFVEPPRTRRFELETRLTTVLLEPDASAVTITWAGSMPVGAPFPDSVCQATPHMAVFV